MPSSPASSAPVPAAADPVVASAEPVAAEPVAAAADPVPAAAEPVPARADPVAAPTEPVAAEPVPPNAEPVSAEPDAAEPAAADPTAAEPVPRMLARPAKPSPATGVGVMGGGGAETCDGAGVDDVVERPGMVRWPSYWPSSEGVGPAEPDGPCCATTPGPAAGCDTGVTRPAGSSGDDAVTLGRAAESRRGVAASGCAALGLPEGELCGAVGEGCGAVAGVAG
ncbi:hypothetical protein [Nocardia sp. NRRL WC-3656]|uniref:hypothetical protein n=1 Tax=Nocardia sp. NRRL WC-3656 TaxID=1463824 RepID=UPI0012DF1D68|nr:hypothetical protein [Nocardia sp. NRRL WC-3656]